MQPANLQPPSVLLMGPSGAGKTTSLATLLEAGLEVFVISTEPRGVESLIDACATRKLSLDKLHWRYIGPTRPGFATLIKQSELIAKFDQKFLSDQKPTDRTGAAWLEVLKTCHNFKDERDGKEYGDISKFGPDRAVVIDSLSGISAMAMDVTIGDKVTAGPGEWGIAMRTLDKLILQCTSDLNCYFILVAHMEKEEDPNTGANQIMVSTLGKKLAPSIPRYFSEVVHAHTQTDADNKRSFFWSTNTPNHVLKNRSLPISSKLDPSFRPVVEAYKSRLNLIAKAS